MNMELVEEWPLGRVTYTIFKTEQGFFVIRKDSKRRKNSQWLEKPESQYETEAGCRYAILCDLSTN